MIQSTRTIVIGSILHLLSFHVFAQPDVQLRVAKGWRTTEQQKPQTLFKELEAEFGGRVFDPRAADLLRAAEAFTKVIFNFSDLRFQRAVTYQKGSRDIMVAQWDIQERSVKGTLILKDAPSRSWYSLRLAPRTVTSGADLAVFLGDILVCRQPPLNVARLEVTVPTAPGIVAFSGSFTHSENAYLYGVYLAGVTTGTDWFLNVNVGKGFTTRYYPIPPFVAERFPPLPELARSWSFDRIWSEVGRPADPEFPRSNNRDRILVEELARRGLSADQLGDLLVKTERAGLGRRATVVFSALQLAGKRTLLASHIVPVLARYESVGQAAEEAVGPLFRSAANDCSPQFEAIAMKTLKGGIFGEGPLIYFHRCTNSEEMVRSIESIPVAERWAERKKTTLSIIRTRLSKNQK